MESPSLPLWLQQGDKWMPCEASFVGDGKEQECSLILAAADGASPRNDTLAAIPIHGGIQLISTKTPDDKFPAAGGFVKVTVELNSWAERGGVANESPDSLLKTRTWENETYWDKITQVYP